VSGRPRGSRRNRTYGDSALVRLRDSNPVEEGALLGPDTPRARAIFQSIISQRFDGHRVPAKVFTVLAALSIAAASVYVLVAREPQYVVCFEAPDIASRQLVAIRGPGTPSASCAQLWESGEFAIGAVADAVPPLQVCVGATGTLAVFPSDDPDLCPTLGLARPDPSGAARDEAIRTANASLAAAFVSSDCLSIADAAQLVGTELERAGLNGWKVEVPSDPPAGSCASFAMESEAETIRLVAIPLPRMSEPAP